MYIIFDIQMMVHHFGTANVGRGSFVTEQVRKELCPSWRSERNNRWLVEIEFIFLLQMGVNGSDWYGL